MKSKVVLNALALLFAAGAMAQDCTFFFPQTKGTQLVKKGYDAKGNLQSVMTYTVDEVKNIPSGLEVEADYVFKNSAGTVYDKGDLEAFCQGRGVLYGNEGDFVQSVFRLDRAIGCGCH